MIKTAHDHMPGDGIIDSSINKVVRLGSVKTYAGRSASIYCKIKFKHGKLSISGVEGPLPSGNALGGCGQIDTHLRDEQESIKLAPSWTRDMIKRFFEVWSEWHLNDMNAECEHQRAFGWKYTTHSGQSCPTCGYQIGTKWLRREVPEDVLDFLRALPETDKTPAWV